MERQRLSFLARLASLRQFTKIAPPTARSGRVVVTLFMMLLTTASTWATITGTGTQTDPYIISSTDDWNTFATNVNNNTKDYSGEYVKLAADITVTTMVGTDVSNSARSFNGTFDGAGHTLTFNYTTTERECAPFKYIDGATFKNLKVTGTINTDGSKAAGFAAICFNNPCTFQNCQSSITLNSTRSGQALYSGFLSYNQNSAKLTFTNCLFDGSITASNATICAGFIGYNAYGPKFSNCLMAGTMTLSSNDGSATLYNGTSGSMSSCYYRTAYGTAQGTAVGNMTNAELAVALGNGWEVKGNEVVPIMSNKDISKATVSGLSEYYDYTGSAIAINYTVKAIDNTVLVKGTDYSEEFCPSTVQALGDYTLTIRGINDYSGSQTFHFTVRKGNWIDHKAASFSQENSNNKTITITSEAEFARLAYMVNESGENYKDWTITLGTDLDLSDYYWTPIGKDVSRTFKANFDGGNHTVSGVSVNTSLENVGLFGDIYLSDDQNNYFFKDLTVTESEFVSTNSSGANAGGIIGVLSFGTLQTIPAISNCHVTGSVSITASTGSYGNYAAGIVGASGSVNISNCTSKATITTTQTGKGKASGFANLLWGNASFSNCVASDAHITGLKVGGIYVGDTGSGAITTGSYYVNCTFTSENVPNNDPLGAFAINTETGVSIDIAPSVTLSSTGYYAYNTEVTFTVTPPTGKLVTGLTVTGADNSNISVTKLSDTSFKINMPYKNITATATYEDTETNLNGTFYDGKLAWAVSKKVNGKYTELTITKVGDDNVELPTSITGDTPWSDRAADITTVVIADGITLKYQQNVGVPSNAFDVVRGADMTSLKRIILTKEQYERCHAPYLVNPSQIYGYEHLIYVRPFAGYDTPFCYWHEKKSTGDIERYGVRTADDWNEFANYVNTDANHGKDLNFYLEKDIDFTDKTFTMARLNNAVFDGYKHTIYGATINEPNTHYVGVFSTIRTCTIKDLQVSKANITGYQSVGAIVGYDYVSMGDTERGSTIENCIVYNCTIKGTVPNGYIGYVGGIIGTSGAEYPIATNRTTVKGCNVNNVTFDAPSGSYAGGIVGNAEGLIRDNFVHSFNVPTGRTNIGGIIGRVNNPNNPNNLELKNNYYQAIGDNIKGCNYQEGWTEAQDIAGAKYAIDIRGNNINKNYGNYVEYDFSRIRAYGDNILYQLDRGIFTGKDQTVPVELTYTGSISDGQTLAGFTADGGTLTHISGNNYELIPTITGNTWLEVNISPVFAENITLANATSNADVIAAKNGKLVNATLADRTLTKDGNWNTLCLPFNVTIVESPLAGDGVVAKVFDNTSALSSMGVLTLKFSDAPATITAGTPFIIKWTGGDNLVAPVFNSVTISNTAAQEVTSSDTKVKFVGQYSPFDINDANKNEILYVASGNKIGYSSKARTLKSCRAHFWVKPTDSNAPAVNSINIDFGDNEVVTGITTTNYTNSTNSDEWYTLDGRKLNAKPNAKGVYINNGKKVVVK